MRAFQTRVRGYHIRVTLKKLCVGAAGFLVAGMAWAQAPADAPPPNAAAILKEIEAIQSRQADNQRKRFETIASELTAAAKTNDSAMRIYGDALRETEFAGNTQRFMEWRDKNKDVLTKDRAVGTAARLHLQYIVLSLHRAATADKLPPFKETWDYAVALAEARETFGGDLTKSEIARNLLERPITDSPIAKARLIRQDLEKLQGWEMSPGSLDGILDKNIRQPLRAEKDPRLVETWKLQIDFRTKAAEKFRSDVALTTFQQVELPRLLWARAKDRIVIGQKNAAINEMVGLVRAYPDHPDLPGWAGELSGLLKPGVELPQPKLP